jgi:peptidoglycan/xylan/chitin deacetylase (PgdA/CDA1 family)
VTTPAPLAPEARWPSGHRCAVVVTVNFDAELALTGPDPSLAPMQKTLSLFRYGTVRGAPRFLEVFAERGVRSSWFVPGALVPTVRDLLTAVVAGGHDLGARGLRLERFHALSPTRREAVLRSARASLRDVVASSECGFRLPSGEWPPGLGAQLLDAGFTWSSSWPGDDLPFFVPAGPTRSIVDLPVTHVMNDRLAFAWNFAPPIPAGHARIASYEEVLHNWLFELRGCRKEGLCLVLQLHPEVTGTAGRIDLVRRFLDDVLESGDVWVATGGEVASFWSATHAGNRPDHPVELFRRVSPETRW